MIGYNECWHYPAAFPNFMMHPDAIAISPREWISNTRVQHAQNVQVFPDISIDHAGEAVQPSASSIDKHTAVPETSSPRLRSRRYIGR